MNLQALSPCIAKKSLEKDSKTGIDATTGQQAMLQELL